MPNIAEISEVNTKWGICGFCSSLGALWCTDPDVQKKVTQITKKDFSTRLLADIKTFLMQYKAKGDKEMLKQLTEFNKNWDAAFTIDGFIGKVNDSVKVIPKDLTLAMTPVALVDYLKLNWELKGNYSKGRPADTTKNVILGLYKKKDAHAYKELKHWVFMKDKNHVYNWGEEKNLADTLDDCAGFNTIDCYIQIP